MGKKKKNSDISAAKDIGVLYIRYDRNTFSGQLIEKRKKESSRGLNKRIISLIFLSEIVEPLNCLEIDLDVLNEAYNDSLRLFTDKLEQTYYKLHRLAVQRSRKKNRDVVSSLIDKDVQEEALAFRSTKNISTENLFLAANNSKSNT